MSHFPPAGRTSCLSARSQDQSRAGPLHWGLRMNGYAVCIYLWNPERDFQEGPAGMAQVHNELCSLLPLVADLCQKLEGLLGCFLSGRAFHGS